MTIEISKGGTVSYTGPDAVEVFRIKTLISALKLQKVGIRAAAARNVAATTVARRDYQCKGNIDKMIEQLEAKLSEALSKVEVIDEHE